VTKRRTIFAVSTAPGKAAVAVVRLSGPGTGEVVRRLVGELPAPRKASFRALRDPATGQVIDRGIVLWFPAPSSFTGEDMAEFQVHGGRAVVADLLAALGEQSDLRPAEPGEFGKRAFLNGKIDLTAAEGIADLVEAETAAQRRQALAQLDGKLGRLVEGWRERLVRALARVEAEIDFADEDLGETGDEPFRHDILSLRQEITQYLDDRRRGERLRDGLSVAIVGPPNAGKSSLLNYLARREAAIVSAVAGTTRDVIEVHLDLAGYPLVVADTAGLRAAADEVEEEGVRRALARANAADLRLVVVEAAGWPCIDASTAKLIGEDSILVLNKVDLLGGQPAARPESAMEVGPRRAEATVEISLTRGDGLGSLAAVLEQAVAKRLGRGGEAPAITRARHRTALVDCVAALERYESAPPGEFAAEDLRLAARSLGRITGRVGVEDILDVVFRDFCIGK
jgi:tRNA modification GTPase